VVVVFVFLVVIPEGDLMLHLQLFVFIYGTGSPVP